MRSTFKIIILTLTCTVFFVGNLWAQPANNTCASVTAADSLAVSSNCSTHGGNLYQATSSTANCGTRYDVWYKFKVPSYATIVNIDVTLTSSPSTLTTANTYVELFNTSTCNLSGTTNGGCQPISSTISFSNLTPGNVYYFRVCTSSSPATNALRWGFNVCVTAPAGSRMNEVFKQTVLGSFSNYPWEVTYGSDDSLYITEARAYKVYKMSPISGSKRIILDISQNSTFLPLADRVFNCQFNFGGSNPQGGLAGLALHPKFLDPVSPQNYVYISYVYSQGANSDPNGIFYTNRLVRFTYNVTTGLLESPVSLCDTLPGSSDHNSQRMIVAPVGGTNYLFYAQGDMGAGQFGNRLRPNNAQNQASYEGKILRFNLVPDGDAGTLDKWIPNNNPFNGASQSAVWATGIRNNQGFAYDSDLGILYGACHGPYSDDEINIIESGKNYGHPLVIGYAADHNYDGISAGAAPGMAAGGSSCPTIGNEVTNANAIGAATYRDPLYSAYLQPASGSGYSSMSNLWNSTNGSGNNKWPSEGWSGLDIYTNKVIPGWKKSLIAAGLKWGRLIRLPLGLDGTTTLPSNLSYGNTGDTVLYFQSGNRYRDLAFDPNGRDIYIIMDNSSATSGPGVGNPTVPACPGCVVKYTFLGYADLSGLSSISKTVAVTNGTANTCNTGTQVTIDATNNSLWVPITGPDGNIMAEINAMGQNLGLVTSSFYQNSGTVRVNGSLHYLDRNITITPAVTSFGTPVKVRLYITKAEFDALKADPLSGILTVDQLKVLKNSDACGSSISTTPILLTPTNTAAIDLAQGANGYVLQVNVSGFSSFYFAANNAPLPIHLLSFTGSLQNNTTTLLNWKTDNEINASYFILERSADGQNFYPITNVAVSGGAATQKSYSYNDNEVSAVLSANVYYRLKMVDINGTYSYSNIVNIGLPQTKSIITITPNPAFDNLQAEISMPAADRVNWQIIDAAGRILMSNDASLNKGNNKLLIKINDLAAGLYYLTIKGAAIESKTQFQKL